jgi:hypothetical protein
VESDVSVGCIYSGSALVVDGYEAGKTRKQDPFVTWIRRELGQGPGFPLPDSFSSDVQVWVTELYIAGVLVKRANMMRV